jgi:hypothetical protein
MIFTALETARIGSTLSWRFRRRHRVTVRRVVLRMSPGLSVDIKFARRSCENQVPSSSALAITAHCMPASDPRRN